MTGFSHKSGKSGARRAAKLDLSTAQIKCRFCGNTFYARPKEAICPKCERPANRDLAPLWRALSLVFPPLGLGYVVRERAHSPFAATQALRWSGGGALIWLVLAILSNLR